MTSRPALPQTPAAARKRHVVTLTLIAFTATSWTAVIAADMLNLPEHIWHALLQVATVAANALLMSVVIGQLHQVNARLDRAYDAIHDLYQVQPDPDLTPRPWPVLRPVGADGEPERRNGHSASR